MKLVHNGIVASNEIRKEVPHDVSSSCSKEVQNLSELSPPPVDIQLIKQEEIIPEEYFSNTSILLDKEPMTVESSSNSIFCSQELDEFLNSETKNLLDKPFFKVEKLKPVYSDVKYNTPAAQSSYIKTLESALHHVRAARNGSYNFFVIQLPGLWSFEMEIVRCSCNYLAVMDFSSYAF